MYRFRFVCTLEFLFLVPIDNDSWVTNLAEFVKGVMTLRDDVQPSIPLRPIPVNRIGEPSSGILKNLEKKQMMRLSAISIIVNMNVCPFQFKRLFICLYCKLQFATMSELQQHNNLKHNDIDENIVRKAMVSIGRIEPVKINITDFTCRLCNQELSNFENLKNHLVGKHNKVIDLKNDGVVPFRVTENTYTCARCDVICENYRQLAKHTNEHYSDYICDQCGSGFTSAKLLKIHYISHQHGSYPCEECGKEYRTILAKQEHYKIIHLNAKKNRCTLCPETFRDYYQKQKHLVDVHGKGQKYSCSHCNYYSCHKNALKLHMICHNDEKNHKCQVCKKSYARRKTLTEHMKSHNNDRRFGCQYCDRAFVQKCSLKGHLKTQHRNVQNLEC